MPSREKKKKEGARNCVSSYEYATKEKKKEIVILGVYMTGTNKERTSKGNIAKKHQKKKNKNQPRGRGRRGGGGAV